MTITKKKLVEIPNHPGVYLFYNKNKEIIYIGKAKSLKNRLKYYFQEQDLDLKTQALKKEFYGFDYIVTDSEKEALILENNLIKKYKPKYNILLRDDKTFPYIKITTEEKYPRLLITRRKIKDGSKYFGPYLSKSKVKNVLRTLERIFPLRTCKNLPKKPCLNYYIKKCIGPCLPDNSDEEYDEAVKGVIAFLSGETKDLVTNLKRIMKNYAQKKYFEKAAEIRDRIKSIELMLEKQKVELPEEKDIDVISGYMSIKSIYIILLNIRGGRIVGWHGFFKKDGKYIKIEDALKGVILGYYNDESILPHKILIDNKIPEKDILEKWIKDKFKKKIVIEMPVDNLEEALCALANKNARILLEKVSGRRAYREEKYLEGLKTVLSLNKLPSLVYGFDVSNLGNTNIVGACVVFKDGKPFKEEYRHYNIKLSDKKKDDYKALSEIVVRKILEVKNEKKNMPELIILDGGQGHLNSVVRNIKNLKIYPMPIVSIAKGKDIVYVDIGGKTADFKNFKESLFFVKKVRDEAHRFAVNFQRTKRKGSLKSSLNKIEGLGNAKISMLLKKFNSVDKMKDAGIEEIAQIKGFGIRLAEKIKENLLR